MTERPQRALVTGASGFIGRHLVGELAKRGFDVTAVSRDLELGIRGVTSVVGDLGLSEFVNDLIEERRPDCVYHFAGLASGVRDLHMVRPTFDANLLTTVNVLTATQKADCGRVVLAGSIEESRGLEPVVPCSPYAASKMAASLYATLFSSLYGASIISLQIAFVYGPGQMDFQRLVPYVIRSCVEGVTPALTDGSRVLDWIYVSDVVEATIRAGTLPGSESYTFSIGTGIGTSVRQIVEMLTGMCRSNVAPEFGIVPNRPLDRERVADITRTTDVLGWEPSVGLTDGLSRTVEWYRELLAQVD